MAKISFLDLPGEDEKNYFKNLKQADRFVFSRVVKNNTLTSRKKKTLLKNKTLFVEVSKLWCLLDESTQNLWKSAGEKCNMSGFSLFLQDYSLRKKNNFSGVGTPSDLHQGKVGVIEIKDDAKFIKIEQRHPHNYWRLRKVLNKKSLVDPVYITEPINLPIEISLNYKSDFSVSGVNPFAKFYVSVISSDKGVDVENIASIDLPFVSNWSSDSATLFDVEGYPFKYSVFFDISDLQGFLYFDNISIKHSGQNWAIDSFCDNIERKHAGIFSKIENAWHDVSVPIGSSYYSKYIEN